MDLGGICCTEWCDFRMLFYHLPFTLHLSTIVANYADFYFTGLGLMDFVLKGGSDSEESACNAGDVCSIPGLGPTLGPRL